MNIFYQRIPELAESIVVSQPKDIGQWVEALTGFSIPTLQTAQEMISHILHSAIGDSPYDPLAVYGTKYALTSGVELAANAYGGVAQSRAQFKRVRDCLVAFGCFTVTDREFTRYTAAEAAERRAEGGDRVRAGQMKRGANKGIKSPGKIHNIDVERMLDISAAIVQIFKGQRTGIDGVDGWTLYKPSHGCAWLAKLWKRVKGFGTLFTPEKHEHDRPHFEMRPKDAALEIAHIENQIGEWWAWDESRHTKGEKTSPMAWEQLRRLKKAAAQFARWLIPPDIGPELAN